MHKWLSVTGLLYTKHLIPRCHLLSVKFPALSISLNAFPGVADKIYFEVSWKLKTRSSKWQFLVCQVFADKLVLGCILIDRHDGWKRPADGILYNFVLNTDYYQQYVWSSVNLSSWVLKIPRSGNTAALLHYNEECLKGQFLITLLLWGPTFHCQEEFGFLIAVRALQEVVVSRY